MGFSMVALDVFYRRGSSRDPLFAHGESKGEGKVEETCLGYAVNQRWGQQ